MPCGVEVRCACLRVENTLLILFLEYAFPERIEPIFHNDSDNQLFNGRDEVDEPIDSSKTCFVEICLWTEEIPPVPIVTGGMVRRILEIKGRRWAAVMKLLVTAIFPRRPSSPLGLIRRCAPFRRERSERAESPTDNHEKTPITATNKSLRNLDCFYISAPRFEHFVG